jgi:hypothetical protein
MVAAANERRAMPVTRQRSSGHATVEKFFPVGSGRSLIGDDPRVATGVSLTDK